MNDSYTAGIRPTSEVSEVCASGPWTEDAKARFSGLEGIRRRCQVAGFALAIAVSPATALQDPWWSEGKGPITWNVQSGIGRPISRDEALFIARRILEQAERERLEVADLEAVRGIQWEGDS